jgi:Uma2 family endonuclease
MSIGEKPTFVSAVSEAEREAREHFYDVITEDMKAEFINGAMIVQSPAKLRHSNCSENALLLLKVYVGKHNLGVVGHEKLLVSLTRNDYEPDICFWSKAKAAKFTPDQMKFPAPDLIIEVLSPSTEKVDRGAKAEDYAAHGVGEYWLIDPEADAETV